MPMVPDLQMDDETYADFTDTVRILEVEGMSRAQAVNAVVAAGLKKWAKKRGEFRAFAAAQGEVTGG